MNDIYNEMRLSEKKITFCVKEVLGVFFLNIHADNIISMK